MKYSYYPGCTLKTKAASLDTAARRAALALGVELEELPAWQCCGGVYTMARDELAPRLAAVRALVAAREKGQPLVAVCSACFHVLAQVNHDMQTDAEMAEKIARYLQLDEPYRGQTRVLHYLQVLRDEIGFDAVRAAVRNPLRGEVYAPYYGCLLLRPAKILQLDDPENPTVLRELLESLGAETVLFPGENECCGGYMALEDAEAAAARSRALTQEAASFGATALVTACPLCRYNLDRSGTLPAVYFTELLARALGVQED